MLVVLGLVLGGLPAYGDGPAACTPRGAPVATGLRELRRTPVAPRTVDVTLASRAVGGTVGVRVQLPVDYDRQSGRRFPVLYLLHGRGADHAISEWIDTPGAVGSAPLIVVMPDGGRDGWYSDWAGARDGGATPGWESFHLRELVPWVDRAFRTVPGRAGRAVAGISMGGYGALAYAARQPDLFAAAGSFSGVVHPDHLYPYAARYLTATRVVGDECVWGSWERRRDRWQAHDPTVLAPNLAGVHLFLTARDGVPAGQGETAATAELEHLIWQMNRSLAARLDALGIPYTADLDGPGTHRLDHWRAALRAFVPWLTARLPAAAPAGPGRHLTGDAVAGAWGWSLHRSGDVRDLVALDAATARGFVLSGTGRVTVVTPPFYLPGARHRVTAGDTSYDVVADRAGRLALAVDLPAAPDPRPPAAGAWPALPPGVTVTIT